MNVILKKVHVPISQLRVISEIKSLRRYGARWSLDEEKENRAIPAFAIIYVVETFTRIWSTIALLRSPIRICLFETLSSFLMYRLIDNEATRTQAVLSG